MGINIKTFRDRVGYKTQMALAKELGIGTANVSEWELGKGRPSYAILEKLLELGATVEELFGVEYANMHYGEKHETLVEIYKREKQFTESDNWFEKMGIKQRIIDLLKKDEKTANEVLEKTTNKVLDDSTPNTDLILSEIKEIKEKLAEQEKEKKLKEVYLNNYFNTAKECIEKQSIEKKDIRRHFFMLRQHYSVLSEMLANIEKKLDAVDYERFNVLNDFIEKKYKKEYFEEEYIGEEGIESINGFYAYFEDLVIYCYRNYCYHEEKAERKYFDKAVEVLNNLNNKIAGENKDISEFAPEFAEWIEVNGYG